MSNNLELWDSVSKTDPKHTKQVKFGRQFTAIDPQWQIKNATEKWGSYGSTWKLKEKDCKFISSDTVCIKSYEFIYPDGSFDISNSISMTNKKGFDDDFMKKIDTDTLTKALSKLGFNADVFLGLFDDNRYVQSMDNEFRQAEKEAYKTQSKSTDNEKKAYWAEFTKDCKSVSVEPMEFLEWALGDTTNKKAVQNMVCKYLKDKEIFFEQLDNYKTNTGV